MNFGLAACLISPQLSLSQSQQANRPCILRVHMLARLAKRMVHAQFGSMMMTLGCTKKTINLNTVVQKKINCYIILSKMFLRCYLATFNAQIQRENDREVT